MSDLAAHIKAIVAEEGPISVERYIEIALTHPQNGYYMNRDPFGAAGDFTTAPEITRWAGRTRFGSSS
jgi:NADH dehydrogenase [ubiquinone] 1 alpha subcomplex assembly factor 7